MRKWLALAIVGTGCTAHDLTPQEELGALERATCEALTSEPTEHAACEQLSSDDNLDAYLAYAGADVGLHRCGTFHPSLHERDAIEARLAPFWNAPILSATGTIEVAVYAHVINKGAGRENG